MQIKVLRDKNSRKNHLGEQLGTNSDAKLARETEVWSQDGHVDAIWRAKGTKFALKDALAAPKWAPRGPKRAMVTIGGPSTGVTLEAGGPPKGILVS